MPRTATTVALVALALIGGPGAAGADAQTTRPDPKDLVVITGTVRVERGETVHNVVVVDGRVTVLGRVTGDLVAVSAPVTLAGTVEGDVVAVADRVTMLPGARVTGDLSYGDERPAIAPGATVEGKVRDENWADVLDGRFDVVARLVLWLAFTVSSLALGMVLLALAPRAADAAFAVASAAAGPAIAWGLGLFIGLPVAAVVALSTLVGIPLGLAVLLALLPLAAIGYTTGAWLLGRAIVPERKSRALAFLAGWGILRAVALVPFLGGAVWFATTVFGLGVLMVALWRARGGPVEPPRVATWAAPEAPQSS